MLIFQKVDEVYFVCKADKDENDTELQELFYHFSMVHPDKQFMEGYINGVWDGTVRFIEYLDTFKTVALVPIGLFPLVVRKMCDSNIDFEILNNDIGKIDIDFSDFDEWLDRIERVRKDKTLSLRTRAYQYDAVKRALEINRCVIESPTGSGKTLMLYTYVLWILMHQFEEGEKFLIVVPDIDLVKQTIKDFISYGADPEWLEGIYSNTKKTFNKPIIVSTWQSLYRYDVTFFDQFSGLVVDEAHKAKAPQLLYISKNCVNARFRVATTGTLQKNTFMRTSIISNFGMAFKTRTTRELITAGYLSDFYIRNIILQWKKVNSGRTKSFEAGNFAEEYDLILKNEERMDMLVDFVINIWNNRDNENETFLIMGKRVEYLTLFYEKLKKFIPKTYLIHGKIESDKRVAIKDTVKETGGIVVANITIMGTGINIPNVSHIVFVNPIKSDILILQSIGRSIRLFPGKEMAIIYDIVDKFSVKEKGDCSTFEWLEDKKKIYDSEDFHYDDITVELQMDFKMKKEIDESDNILNILDN